MKFARRILVSSILLIPFLSGFLATAQENELTKTHHQVKHILLISVDGLHALDLANYIKAHPGSTLEALSDHGNTYTNDSTSLPSDSFPGLAALITGGTPTTTGFWYDVTYNRSLSPPALTTPYGIVGGAGLCPGTKGTQVGFDEEIDNNLALLNGGGGIDPNYLPRDPDDGCKPVYPHSYLRVNTIFEVIKAHGGYTAWTDKHPSYEWVNGPSGNGVDDFYGPEINSIPVNLPQVTIWPCNPLPVTDSGAGAAWTDNVPDIKCYDALKVQAVLNQIDGFTHDRSRRALVPTIFGMNFQAVSVGQKVAGNGYTDVLGTPSAGLEGGLEFVDQMLGLMVAELKEDHVYDSTLIIIGAKHGQSSIDVQKADQIGGGQPQTTIGGAEAFDISDDGSLIWLTNPSLTPSIVSLLSEPANQKALGIQEIFAGQSLEDKFNTPGTTPGTDPRTPDIILKTNTGVIFTGGTKIAEHGGLNEDDYHVALLVSLNGMEPKTVKSYVWNTQVAPTILKVLGIDPNELEAVQKEQTQVLPFLFTDESEGH